MTDTKKAPFSLKTVIVFWLKCWPITIALIIIGLLAGLYTAKDAKPSFTSETTLLIVNEIKGTNQIDYARIASSPVIQKEAFENAGISKDSCVLENSPAGDFIVIKAICANSAEDSTNLSASLQSSLEEKLPEIYDNPELKVVDLTDSPEVIEDTGTSSRFLKVSLFTFTGLLISIVGAFVWIDFKYSK